MILRISLVMWIAFLSGCVGGSTIIVGNVSDPVVAEEVELFYSSSPPCDFDVVAWMQFPGEYMSQETLINAMRYRAATLGASALQVTYVQKSGSTTYRGSARALRCQS